MSTNVYNLLFMTGGGLIDEIMKLYSLKIFMLISKQEEIVRETSLGACYTCAPPQSHHIPIYQRHLTGRCRHHVDLLDVVCWDIMFERKHQGGMEYEIWIRV